MGYPPMMGNKMPPSSMGMPVPPGLGMPHSTPMMAAGNPYGPSGPPPAALSGSIPPVGPMYPGPAAMHPQSMPPKVPSNLNTIQLQQLSAQIKAYKLLSRNVPPPEALLSIVSGRRPTPAMLTAGKFNRPQMSPQQRAMMGGHPPSHLSSGGQSVPSPKSSVGQTPPSGGAEIPGGQPANISLYPPSPSRSQSGSPKPPIQPPPQSQSQLTQSHSNIPNRFQMSRFRLVVNCLCQSDRLSPLPSCPLRDSLLQVGYCMQPPTCDVTCDPIYDNTFPANNNLKYGSTTPVNMYPPSSMGLHDVYGNVWEWTEDHFNGLPGFKTSFLYDDFSSPCFDGRHNVMMGGSWVSTGDEASRFARYAFRRHFLQHLGFRLARSTSSLPVKLCNAEVFVLGPGVSGNNPITAPGVELGQAMIDSANIHFQCETQEKLEAQLLLEYERDETSNASFVEFVDTVVKEQGCDRDSIIRFGCGTGVKSFLLTKVFEKVTGVDFSGRFLDAAIAIQRGCPVEFETMKEAVVPDIAGIDVDRVLFKQLTWVPNEIEGYNMVLFEFIDRLSEPKGWLLKLWECVTTGGILIFLTAADSEWSETKLGEIIGKRFDLKKKTNIGNKMATIWQLKP